MTDLFAVVGTCRGGGYMYARTRPAHPRANSKGLYPLHRVLAENKLGRLLLAHEQVHHIDEDKTNNSPDNLAVLSRSEHTRQHKILSPLSVSCGNCGKDFRLKPHVYRQRLERNKTRKLYCSSACGSVGGRQLAVD